MREGGRLIVPGSIDGYKGVPMNNMQVLNSIEGEGLALFSGSFDNYAKANGQAFIIVQFPEGKPEAAMYDRTINCTQEDVIKAMKAIVDDDWLFGGGYKDTEEK